MIHMLPSLKVLDFQKVKQKVRVLLCWKIRHNVNCGLLVTHHIMVSTILQNAFSQYSSLILSQCKVGHLVRAKNMRVNENHSLALAK